MSNRRFLILLGWISALLFNNWVLGTLLNHRLFIAGGSVSEFSASTQPYHWLFRSLDIASGVVLCILAIFLYKALPSRRYWRWLSAGTLILGLANCLDAILPLPCSGTVDPHCNAPVRINFQRISLPDHVFSSTVIGICYVLIPLAAYLYARRSSNGYLKLVSILTLVATLIFFGLLITESLLENSLFDHLAGYSQGLQMLIFGWLYIWLATQAVHEQQRS